MAKGSHVSQEKKNAPTRRCHFQSRPLNTSRIMSGLKFPSSSITLPCTLGISFHRSLWKIPPSDDRPKNYAVQIDLPSLTNTALRFLKYIAHGDGRHPGMYMLVCWRVFTRLAGTREPIRLPFQLVGVKSFYGIFLTGGRSEER